MSLSESGDIDARILALLRKRSTADEGVCLFYEIHGGALLGRLQSKFRTFEHSQIEDLLTDTVVKLIGNKGVHPPIRAWVYTVARNRGLDILRRERGQEAILQYLDNGDLEAFAETEPRRPSESDTAWLDQLQRCMNELSPQQRAVMFEDLSGLRDNDRQMAEELGTTELSIRQARLKGRNRVRACMKRGRR